MCQYKILCEYLYTYVVMLAYVHMWVIVCVVRMCLWLCSTVREYEYLYVHILYLKLEQFR